MSYLNLDLDYFDHRKTRRLVGLLGRGAAELPIRLWCYCGKYHAESGDLTAYSPQEIESIVGWWGRPGEFMKAMEKVGFLLKEKEGWKVKDWLDINGHLVAFQERAKTAAKARWDKYRSNATSIAKIEDKQSPIPTIPTIPNQLLTPPTPSFKGKKKTRLRIEDVQIPEDLKELDSEIREWLQFKHEKNQGYRPTGLKNMWGMIRAIPQEKRSESIKHAMAQNWTGIYEKKESGGPRNGNTPSGNKPETFAPRAEEGKYARAAEQRRLREEATESAGRSELVGEGAGEHQPETGGTEQGGS